MPKTNSLPDTHYASRWTQAQGVVVQPKSRVNNLGIEYARTPDGPEKEALLLEIIQCFDPFLRKYLMMITRGHLPRLNTPAGRESELFLRTILKRGLKPTRENLSGACRSLYLAFQQMEASDIYDVLVLCMIKAARQYDPDYGRKFEKVAKVIHGRLSRKVQFSTEDVTQCVGFDASRFLRMLVRKKYLSSIRGKNKKVIAYKRSASWPPSKDTFPNREVPFLYYVPLYFRYFLHDHIVNEMGNLESKGTTLQLDHRKSLDTDLDVLRFEGEDGLVTENIPNYDGSFVGSTGGKWHADVTLMNQQMDISDMDLAWVEETKDRLFYNLKRSERYLLYLIYKKQMTWKEVASVLKVSPGTAKRRHAQLIQRLHERLYS